MVVPASSRMPLSDQSMIFGPNTAAWGASRAPASSRCSASGAGSLSSCSNQTHSVLSSRDEPDSGTWAFADRWRSALATATP